MVSRQGFTMVEIVLVCIVIGIVAAIAVPKMGSTVNSLRLRQAAHDVAGAVTLARAAALRRSDYARLIVDSTEGQIRIESGGDTLLNRSIRKQYRVNIRATRDTITYAANGLGFGVANSTIVVSIGQRAESVTVSRLGRMRRSW